MRQKVGQRKKAIEEKRGEISSCRCVIENLKNTQTAHEKQLKALGEQRELLEKRGVEIRAAERAKNAERDCVAHEMEPIEPNKSGAPKERN